MHTYGSLVLPLLGCSVLLAAPGIGVISGPLGDGLGCRSGCMVAPADGSIAGHVVDPDGKPVVAVVRLAGSTAAGKKTRDVIVKSDRAGAFRAGGLAAGTWWLRSEAPGYYQKLIALGTFPSPLVSPSVDLAPGAAANIVLHMALRSVLVGRVSGPDGRPLVKQQVRLSAPRPEGFTASWSLKTDRQGHYRVSLDYDGEEYFTLSCAGIGSSVREGVRLAGGKEVRLDFRVLPQPSTPSPP